LLSRACIIQEADSILTDAIPTDAIPTNAISTEVHIDRLKFTSTDTSLRFTFTFSRGRQFHVYWSQWRNFKF